ncbi:MULTISPECIES: phosphogluconate dehydrogenase (NAD(+)-dependent, decarboxylating) [Aerococcus]|uniref:Decarboxylating 6-phosphogluconate dehydrogenase n=2 Tax=Aerococcus TaxID=1375 RepID=A0A1E9PN68_9LACT|nr:MULTISPECIES: decarboxylating 6-phosphogluconate dehydrogenase [Aerococcus]KAA9290495.1 decarboxylating 6-phosphogluconate dehydrogenase [Aerococcus mictus]MBU5611135.1 decarboxylating 6-phosphogluconate dehydrogenase [Aerococcus urinae]MCY3039697.1 decarboxylating 6-phosphogluconate dehydrogenase [Aerococcus sp. Group 2]MCY3041935.1 decarboxylating 6-phosphogluconate dehydrogenase [Aerococcus sp. Group 2]MCY3043154.1 decarboxylating 6-phosphogluconate dehydrogenase [Aerococcus sp. Group 2]
MKIGMIGLGKMGASLAENMSNHGVEVLGYDQNPGNPGLTHDKFTRVTNLDEMIAGLSKPRVVWLLVPAGDITNSVIDEVSQKLDPGDLIIDGGNSFFKDSIANYEKLKEDNIYFLDCGTSGGMSGALNGGNFMIGGDQEAFKIVEPVFEKISWEGGYLYTGKAGSGHYLKMIHNGIEYGMMAAIGEGFDVLEHSQYEYDYEAVANLWNNGSVIRSWLMELAADAFKKDAKLEGIEGVMYSSGEGKWTVEEALDLQVSIPVITSSLMSRYRSLESDTFNGKVVSALRNGFGGHAMKKKEN